MATIQITLKPKKDPQKVFTAGQVAEAIHGKKLLLGWDDDFDQKKYDKLYDGLIEDLQHRMKDRVEGVANLRKRVGFADRKRESVAGTLSPGNHILKLKVLAPADVEDEDEGPDMFPIRITIGEPDEEPEAADFDSLVTADSITFSSTKVKNEVKGDKKNRDKAASIYERGKSYRGHGPTSELGGAFHAHVTTRTALGFKWSGDTLEIVGVGEKSDGAAPGGSGYTWTT